jgi:hypothetical protein
MSKQTLKILLIFVCCAILLAPAAKNGYADSILGTGVSIQSDGKTGHGTLKINSVTYQAPNLTIQMGNIIKISGDVFSGTVKSKLVISGIKVKDTLYNFSGFLIGNNGMTNVKLDLYIASANPTTVKPSLTSSTQKTIQMNQIKLVVKSYANVIVGYSYGFEVKTFDKKSNPTGNFDQKYGNVAGVNIVVTLKDKNGKTLMKFNGITNSQGYYSDSKPVVNYLPSVTYQVIFNATKTGYLSDSVIKTVFIQANSR